MLKAVFCALIFGLLAAHAAVPAAHGALAARTVHPAATAADCTPAPTGTDHSGRSFVDHDFHADPPASLRGANFANADLRGAAFSTQDLTGACFAGANLGPSPHGGVDFTNATLDHASFVGANLDETDFSFATITCADFSNTSLMEAWFGQPAEQTFFLPPEGCRTSFRGATIDVRTVDPANWNAVDFTGARLQNVSPALFSLAGKDAHGALLVGTSFVGIDMSGADLSYADFRGTVLREAKLDNAALNGALLGDHQGQATDLTGASFRCASFYLPVESSGSNPRSLNCTATRSSKLPGRGAVLTNATLRDVDLTWATLDRADLSGANLENARLAGASLVQANLEAGAVSRSPAVLNGADLADADFSSAHLSGVDFGNVLLPRAVFDGTSLNGTKFTAANMPEASFRNASLQGVDFRGALLQSATFAGATLSPSPSGDLAAVSFSCAHLEGADFSNAKVTAANFTAATMPADCCPNGVCGTVALTQRSYRATTYPAAVADSTCPNGDAHKACSGSDWAVPGWTSSLCSASGLPETLWAKPDCGGGGSGGTTLAIPDAGLRRCILAAIRGADPNAGSVPAAAAALLETLECPALGIADATGLAGNFPRLKRLDLSHNVLTALAFPRGTAPALETLDVSGNRLTTLGLAGADALARIDASENRLQGVTFSPDAALVTIDLSRNQLTAVPLAAWTTAAYVDLSSNALTKLMDVGTSLQGLTSLVYLDLSGNQLTTIGAAPTAPGLQQLSLACNPHFECSTLGLDANSCPSDPFTPPSPACNVLHTSDCAAYDTTTATWTVLAQPPLCSQQVRRPLQPPRHRHPAPRPIH